MCHQSIIIYEVGGKGASTKFLWLWILTGAQTTDYRKGTPLSWFCHSSPCALRRREVYTLPGGLVSMKTWPCLIGVSKEWIALHEHDIFEKCLIWVILLRDSFVQSRWLIRDTSDYLGCLGILHSASNRSEGGLEIACIPDLIMYKVSSWRL